MSTNLKMEPSIKVNGAAQLDMVVVFKYGLMVLATKVNGKIIKRTERESSGT